MVECGGICLWSQNLKGRGMRIGSARLSYTISQPAWNTSEPVSKTKRSKNVISWIVLTSDWLLPFLPLSLMVTLWGLMKPVQTLRLHCVLHGTVPGLSPRPQFPQVEMRYCSCPHHRLSVRNPWVICTSSHYELSTKLHTEFLLLTDNS